MLKHYKYTDKEIKELLSTLTVIIDTRENEITHITKYFDQKKIPFISQKLDVGDYSCLLPYNPDYGIQRDYYFPAVIERKNSLEELSANLSSERHRFESELIRSHGQQFTLLIEDGSYEGIIMNRYKTEMNPKSFLATLFAFKNRYNIDIQFIRKEFAGTFIFHHFYYFLRELLK